MAETGQAATANTSLNTLSTRRAKELKGSLVETLQDNLVEAEVQTLGNRQKDVKFQALGMLHSC